MFLEKSHGIEDIIDQQVFSKSVPQCTIQIPNTPENFQIMCNNK